MVKTVGDLLLERRKELKMTQPYLAELAGVSINTLYKIERNEGNPTLEVLRRIGLILGLEVTFKLAESNEDNL
ncbi:transcriptional regulator with XRE-family HTH domain [Pedobacter sp. AK013]|uniref:helix-turn-helix transcriptional regulator n=1 Tax=Pedobacter sp. AK013 TaxID=2723071 RepID=UPI00161B7888|nr:helix-turn-helix transcriptional regulator [Pedobacter sp. AK013]MBB6240336.1 transcriptional regulator with XRE-family HTH domain [Pedobacter sp. AK013]